MTAIAASADRSSFLRRVLLADAAACLVTGLLLALLAPPLALLFALPEALLLYAGLALVPIAAFIAWVGSRESPPRRLVRVIVAGNALWVAGSVLVPILFSPGALGVAFVLAQAALVALLAEAEHVGLRRAA